MRIRSRGVRRSAAAVFGALLVVVSVWPSSASTAGIQITSVNGKTGAIVRTTSTRGVVVNGTAERSPGLLADAGDSAFVPRGGSAHLLGRGIGGSGSYDYRWSTDRGTLGTPTEPGTVIQAGDAEAGVAEVRLQVTDRETGASATDVVNVFIGGPQSARLIDVTQVTGPGVPDEDQGLGLGTSGLVDGQTYRYPFSIEPGTTSVRLQLGWTSAPSTTSDFDLYLEGPSTRYADSTDGATGDKNPEILEFEAPEAGDYVAVVAAYATEGDTFRLTVDTTKVAANPIPSISVGGPYRFEVPAAQTLTAGVSGGTAPYSVSWDLDQDGLYETSGAEATTQFPLGNRLVTAKVIDAAGYERHETTGVRVVPPGSALGFSPIVVIGINDTGINPYHREFAATTYPDRSILEASADFTKHPSTYIEGFPASAESLAITLGEGYLPDEDCPDITAEERQSLNDGSASAPPGTCAGGVWNAERIKDGRLYWIPGTKIVGARTSAGDEHPILDDNGHGTGTASVSVGNAMGSCPSCLLVFNEGYYDDWMKTQPWIDLVSNSYGNINLTPDLPVNIFGSIDVKSAVERGQTWLFASGNGHGNAFLVPNTTYTQDHNRGDWILRVGAVDAGSKKPLTGDGGPADVSSYGDGFIPSASPLSADGATTFGGTSCATPITAGVFGLVLAAAREALGDAGVGQADGSVLASGTPLDSPYLEDGQLTRAELWELVLKTALPSGEPDTEASFLSPSYPLEEYHYLFGGYGVADVRSAGYAIQVLLGEAELPDRVSEDDFFRRDSALRVELAGTWTGYEEEYGSEGSAAAASFAGVTPPAVDTLPEALSVLDPTGTLAPADSSFAVSAPTTVVAAGTPSAAGAGGDVLAAPAAGSTVDATLVPEMPVAGNVGVRAGREVLRLYPRQSVCGSGEDPSLSPETGPDAADGCRSVIGSASMLGSQGYFFSEYLFPGNGLTVAIDGARSIAGKVEVETTVAGQLVMVAQLLQNGGIVGEQRTYREVLPDQFGVTYDLSFGVHPRFANVPLDDLSLRIAFERQTGDAALSLDDPETYIDVPVAPSGGRSVELSVDDPTFTTGNVGSVEVDERDGTWGRNIPTAALADGTHTVYARQVTDGVTGGTLASTFTVTRSPDPFRVAVDLVRTDRSAPVVVQQATLTASGWTTTFDRTKAPRGSYVIVARSFLRDIPLHHSAPVTVKITR